MLPEIGGKFSSWAKEDQNLNELDELLMEHDLLNENPASSKVAGQSSANGRGTQISASVHVRSKENRTASPDQFDFEDVIEEFGDGIEAGGGDLEERHQRVKGNGNEDSNSFDLDNSDDLNRFI